MNYINMHRKLNSHIVYIVKMFKPFNHKFNYFLVTISKLYRSVCFSPLGKIKLILQ